MAGEQRGRGGEDGSPGNAPGGGGPPAEEPRYGQYGPYGQPPAEEPRYGQYGPVPRAEELAPPWHGPDDAPQQGRYGPPPAYGQYGQPAPPGAPPGWGPTVALPLQPGIVPLRPLNLGEILDGAFRAIRANPRVMFGLSLIVMAAAAVLDSVLVVLLLDDLGAVVGGTITPETAATLGVGSLLGALVSVVASSFATTILTGLLILSVSEAILGRVIELPTLWQRARGQVWRLVGQTVVVGLIVSVALVAVVLAAAAVAATAGGDGPAVALVVVLALLGGLVLLAWLYAKLALAAPALMLERIGIGASLRRSWALSRGQFWRVLGTLVVALVIVAVATVALSVPISVVTAIVFAQDPYGLGAVLFSSVSGALVSALTVPFLAAVVALVYVDIRMRTEGLDIALAHAAEAR